MVPLSHSPERVGETPAVVVCGAPSPLTQVIVVPAVIVRSSSVKLRISELMAVGSGVWVVSGGTGVCVAANAVDSACTGVGVTVNAVGVGGAVIAVAATAAGTGVDVPAELPDATTVTVAVINGCMVQK